MSALPCPSTNRTGQSIGAIARRSTDLAHTDAPYLDWILVALTPMLFALPDLNHRIRMLLRDRSLRRAPETADGLRGDVTDHGGGKATQTVEDRGRQQ